RRRLSHRKLRSSIVCSCRRRDSQSIHCTVTEAPTVRCYDRSTMEVRRVFEAGNQMQKRFREQPASGKLPQPSDLLGLTLGVLNDSAEMATAILGGGQQE